MHIYHGAQPNNYTCIYGIFLYWCWYILLQISFILFLIKYIMTYIYISHILHLCVCFLFLCSSPERKSPDTEVSRSQDDHTPHPRLRAGPDLGEAGDLDAACCRTSVTTNIDTYVYRERERCIYMYIYMLCIYIYV